jgi:hypothetical protein
VRFLLFSVGELSDDDEVATPATKMNAKRLKNKRPLPTELVKKLPVEVSLDYRDGPRYVSRKDDLMTQLHWKYGHLEPKLIRRLLSSQAHSGLESLSNADVGTMPEGCTPCLAGRIRKAHSGGHLHRDKRIGSTWNFDDCGPFATEDLRGNRWFRTATDDASNKQVRWLIKDNSAVHMLTCLNELKALCVLHGHTVRAFRWDQQGAYIGTVVDEWCAKNNVVATPTTTKDKNGNSIAEVTNLHALNRMRTMLIGQYGTWWGLAALFDTTIFNIVFHSGGSFPDQVPDFTFTGFKPTSRTICAFGCTGVYYAHESNKLKPRGVPGIYVGQGPNGNFLVMEAARKSVQRIPHETQTFVAELRVHQRLVYECLTPGVLNDLYSNFPSDLVVSGGVQPMDTIPEGEELQGLPSTMEECTEELRTSLDPASDCGGDEGNPITKRRRVEDKQADVLPSSAVVEPVRVPSSRKKQLPSRYRESAQLLESKKQVQMVLGPTKLRLVS